MLLRQHQPGVAIPLSDGHRLWPAIRAVLFGDGAERDEGTASGVGEHNVQPALVFTDLFENAVKVAELITSP